MGSSLPIRFLRIWAKAASRSVGVGAMVVAALITVDGAYRSVFSSASSEAGATRPRKPELALELILKYCLGPLVSCLVAEGSGSSTSLRMLHVCGGGQSTYNREGGRSSARCHGMIRLNMAVVEQ